jgi:hypothetical protein
MRHKPFDLKGARASRGARHLYSPAGFLDGSWWHRTYWLLGGPIGDGYGGWPSAGNAAPSGRILVADAGNIYGYGRNQYASHGSHVGLSDTRYRLFAAAKDPVAPQKPAPNPGKKKRPGRRRPPNAKVKYHWSRPTPVVARALLLAGNTLFIAGPVDGFSSTDAYRGKNGVKLIAVATADGAQLAELKLDAVPVFDGMAAAAGPGSVRGRLYLAATDGTVLCFEKKQ